MEPYEIYTKSQPVDEGRFAVTKNPSDKYVFKVPILRNVAETPPYFHDGSVDKLEDAIMIMAKIQLGKDLTKEQGTDGRDCGISQVIDRNNSRGSAQGAGSAVSGLMNMLSMISETIEQVRGNNYFIS